MIVAAFDPLAPRPIPCPGSLPCLTEDVQTGKESGGVLKYITDAFGTNFLTGFLGLIAAAAVIFIIIGGTRMLLATGNEEEIKKAKSTITWAIIGLVIAILSVAIVRIISSLDFNP